jgi:adenosylcobalamin-dependent ribonucleoside-triphosphate reductase
MDIDHAIGDCVVAGGVRRSARMSIVRWDDPDIFNFLECKSDFSKHWTTNISVEIDNEFIHGLSQPAGSGDVRSELAKEVHKKVVAGMINNGEPGYWNSELSNVGEIGGVNCTNPCGEIALEEWENCNLGHVNLESFANSEGIERAHQLVTRFVIRATFGDVNDPKQAAVLAKNRRIGVGHLGVQGYLNRRGIKYSEAPSTDFPQELVRLKSIVRKEARDYAFELRIPEPIKVTTVAPTGSIAKMPGATEGIHPIYAKYFIRRIRFSKLRLEEIAQVNALRAKGYRVLDDTYAANTYVVEIPTMERLVADVVGLGYDEEIVESVDEIPLNKMLEFQSMYQTHYADNAVSFTVNFPEGQYTQKYVEGVLAKYLPTLKGTTLMPDGTRPLAPYERLTKEQFEDLAVNGWSEDSSVDEECAQGSCPIR